MNQADDELLEGVRRLRGVFHDGTTPELAGVAYALLGAYLTFQPIVVWDELCDSEFGGDNEHLAVVGSVLYELPGPLWDYLIGRPAPDPDRWDFRPARPSRVNAPVTAADPTGINRLRR